MVSERKSWLPREGFHLSVLTTLLKQTILNPTITLPLYILSQYTDYGRGIALDRPLAVKRLKVLLYLSIARYVNALLNQGAQNQWTSDQPRWSRELVVVTGGSDGMGRLLVEKFAHQGVKVIVLDIQEPVGGLPGSTTHYIKCDLSSLEEIHSAAAQIRESHGDPTVLLLNAGIINRHSILNTPDHLLRRVFDVNTLSHYRLVKEFLPAMVKANHGLVSTTASLAGSVTCAGMVDYAATKAAAVAFHEGLTTELATRYNATKIRTLCVCPNFVHTKLAEGFLNQSSFVNPTLHPETVVEAQFDRVWRWDGGMLTVPPVQSSIAQNIRAFPFWMSNGIRNRLGGVMSGVEAIEQERVERLREMEESDSVAQASVSQSIVDVQKGEDGQPQMFG